jgi:hypothetical protein
LFPNLPKADAEKPDNALVGGTLICYGMSADKLLSLPLCGVFHPSLAFFFFSSCSKALDDNNDRRSVTFLLFKRLKVLLAGITMNCSASVR